jgi:hypothetical protein
LLSPYFEALRFIMAYYVCHAFIASTPVYAVPKSAFQEIFSLNLDPLQICWCSCIIFICLQLLPLSGYFFMPPRPSCRRSQGQFPWTRVDASQMKRPPTKAAFR